MKTITPRFDIIRPKYNHGIYCLQVIEAAARISHRSEDLQTDTSWERFIKSVVLEHGDWSVVEHASATVVFRLDRGVTHEFVRHRLFSFTQESTRFVNLGKRDQKTGELVRDMEFIYPAEVPRTAAIDYLDPDWESCMLKIEDTYMKLLAKGWRPQEARSVLPNALASTIEVTGNLRNWRHILLMRTTKETHPDFKRIMIPLLEAFKSRIPLLFDDIAPNARQIDNMRLAR